MSVIDRTNSGHCFVLLCVDVNAEEATKKTWRCLYFASVDFRFIPVVFVKLKLGETRSALPNVPFILRDPLMYILNRYISTKKVPLLFSPNLVCGPGPHSFAYGFQETGMLSRGTQLYRVLGGSCVVLPR